MEQLLVQFSTALLSHAIRFPFLTSLIKTVSALTICCSDQVPCCVSLCCFPILRFPIISTTLLGCTVFVSASPTEGAQQDALCKHIHYSWPLSVERIVVVGELFLPQGLYEVAWGRGLWGKVKSMMFVSSSNDNVLQIF